MPPKASKPRSSRRGHRGLPERAGAIFARLAAANPNPKGELVYVNPFTLLVAVVLSAQATDASVNEATRELFKVAHTPDEMLVLGEARLREAIKRIGLYRTKAKNVIALSRMLVERHGGAVPGEREALEALPGVGRKTASVVLNTAFGQPTVAVDTHVFRVAHRLGLARAATPHGVELELLGVIPRQYLDNAHHWMILHGRYVCRARSPRCDACVVCDLCTSGDKRCDSPPPPTGTAGGATRGTTGKVRQ